LRCDCGLTGVGELNEYEKLVLAHTPGIPLEWIYAALRMPRYQRTRLAEQIDAADSATFAELGAANAETVVEGDGWKMLVAVCPGYAGAVPMWSQVELRLNSKSDQAVAEALGVRRRTVQRWRTKAVFCPLTGVRLIKNRGRTII
jgi:hypothetical protein